VYEAGAWKFYGLAAAVGRCASEMQMVIEGRATAGLNAATTERKERRAKAKEKLEKAKAEGRKEGTAYAALSTSPDSQSSEEERDDGSPEPNGSQQGAEDEASEDKEDIADGRINDEQEAEVEVSAEREVAAGTEGAQEGRDMMGELPQRDEERDEEAAEGAEAAQALRDGTQEIRKHAEEKVVVDEEHEAEWRMLRARHEEGETAPLAGESGGGGACSFSSSPVDKTHHSPRGKRRMSDEEDWEEETRQLQLELEKYGSSRPKSLRDGGTEEEWRVREEERKRVSALRRRYYQQEKERKKIELLREVANGKAVVGFV
jgi:hypothetical protein